MFNIKKRLVLLFSLILYSSMFSLGIVNPVSADILGAYGLLGDGAGKYCADTKSPWHYELKLVSECRTGANKYVPHNGYYTYRVTLLDANTQAVVATYDQTPSMYLNAKDWINHQGDWQLSGPDISLPEHQYWICGYLVDNQNGTMYALGIYAPCFNGNSLPPEPVPDTSCTFNSGNDLTVSLGSLERGELPTTPDTGTAKTVEIPVNCTGGDVPMTMKLSYMPISAAGNEVVKTSANGVGVAILYNGKTLSTSETTPINFLEGSSTLSLAFQALRDSNVEVKDIPTGTFTASAVMTMTQQ
ncbi:fimbrial protein [Atlantibacter sp.]|uniref:fimbrial protein n=1 Tax=Atlantibacter sp. TaxID=1903473 RepID=UPI0028ACCFBE|nr:fimbrial protein [Atlantibacter sp.]